MFKKVLSGALFIGLLAVSASSNAILLINHHNQPYREYIHHVSPHRPDPKASHTQRHQHSYSQHAKVTNTCLRMKNGRRERVC